MTDSDVTLTRERNQVKATFKSGREFGYYLKMLISYLKEEPSYLVSENETNIIAESQKIQLFSTILLKLKE
jgi:hypothetical protein